MQDLPQLSGRRPLGQLQVAAFRQEDVDRHTAIGGGVQRADECGIGNEIGGDDRQRLPDSADGSQNRVLQCVQVFVRTIGDTARQHCSDVPWRHVPWFVFQQLARGKVPVHSEASLKL